MKPTLLVIHGPMAVGKSTVCSKLYDTLKDFVFVDKAYIKDKMLKRLKKEDSKTAKQITNKTVFFMLQQLLPLKKNILIQEVNANEVQNAVGELLEQNQYRIISFRLDCSVDTAKKRDLTRKSGNSKVEMIEHTHATKYIDPQDIVINTEENNIDETVSVILSNIR